MDVWMTDTTPLLRLEGIEMEIRPFPSFRRDGTRGAREKGSYRFMESSSSMRIVIVERGFLGLHGRVWDDIFDVVMMLLPLEVDSPEGVEVEVEGSFFR
jgi:hypothetical protein